MKKQKFTMDAISQIDFSIIHYDSEAPSALNHNEPHIHKECEIYLNLSGNVCFEVENHIYPVSRGSVVITKPYEYHHCIYLSNVPHEHFWITFSAEENNDILKLFFNRKKGKDNLIILDEDLLNECSNILKDLLGAEADPLSRRIGFLQLIRIISNGKSGYKVGDIENMPQDIMIALSFMDEHLTEELNIETLSAACNVSVNTLERHFKETLGVSPFAMLRKKRLIASMELLRNGSSVTVAALESGFSDYSNYIQLFRKQFGFTPLQYKKKFNRK